MRYWLWVVNIVEGGEGEMGICEFPIPRSIPRSESVGPVLWALRREMKSVTAIVSVGGFA